MKRQALGSGVIVKYDRRENVFYILTNNHVVENSESITVRFDRFHEKKAQIVGTDPETDIAVIKVSARGIENPAKRVATLGDSSKLKVGQLVIAIGNPYGLERTVTVGVISALKRSIGLTEYESFIQTDAPINPGNSGGPLIDIEGKVIGINTAIVAEGQGLGFAVPINLARWVMNQIIEKGRVVRGWLGVVIQNITPDIAEVLNVYSGVLVAQVVKNSPAEKAGLKVGDVILLYNGQKVEDVRDLQLKVMQTPPGKRVPIEVMRGNRRITLWVKIGELPSKRKFKVSRRPEEGIGLIVRNLTQLERERLGLDYGILVKEVIPNSLAYESGLRRGDIILEVNRVKVRDVSHFVKLIRRFREMGKSKVLLLIRRGRSNQFLVLKIRSE